MLNTHLEPYHRICRLLRYIDILMTFIFGLNYGTDKVPTKPFALSTQLQAQFYFSIIETSIHTNTHIFHFRIWLCTVLQFFVFSLNSKSLTILYACLILFNSWVVGTYYNLFVHLLTNIWAVSNSPFYWEYYNEYSLVFF